MVNVNRCYKVYNAYSNRCDINIIDGCIDINGKLYY